MEEKDIQVIKGAVTEALDPVAKDVAAIKTKTEEHEKELKGFGARMERLERSPIVKDVSINTIPKYYKGFKLSRQLAEARNIASRDKGMFEMLHVEEKADEFAKWLIDISKAARKNPDMQAKDDLREFYGKFFEKMAPEERNFYITSKANMVEGTGANGGYLVPDEYLWDMCMLGRAYTFALQECLVIPMGTDQKHVPAELTLASVSWTTPETGQMTAGEPTLDQVNLACKRLDGIATVTNELLNDSATDVAGLLANQFGYAVALELDNQVLSGTGTPVSGLTTAKAGLSVVLSTGNTNFSAVTATDFSTAIYTLAQGDLLNARFILNRICMHYVRSLKTTANAPIFAAPGGGVPGTIWEYPYFVSEKITNTTAISTAFAVFGNFKKYYIGRRLGSGELDMDPYGKFDYYQTRFRIVTRWALAPGRTSAFVRMMTAAA